ncbi:hypothetical protein HMN09_00264200 [Mycena chlorophos]|uniref:Transmembrane protein 188 n=1 Tax=Mycena chlorophos TaxID=658473 RepID=A0A8H6TM85_MYCCL|nr:hypothetical protein HMN09_00264200 [Mycena chlorophos]
MPPRSSPSPKNIYPQNDVATYRDLLLFEERLKSTAASLQQRKARYQLFLVQLLCVIAFLLLEVLLPPDISLIAIPLRAVLVRLLPDIYTPEAAAEVRVHPYFATGLLFVSVTTLALFFASGTYADKIAYANKYVPHANKTLRSFNMVLNVRQPPLRSKLKLWHLNPLAFFIPRPPIEETVPTPVSTPSHSRVPSLVSPPSNTKSPKSPGPGPGSSSTTLTYTHLSPVTQTLPTQSPSPPTPIPIAPMPPTTNPRGELRFSSRIDKAFREGYERYRANFERRRAEREQQARIAQAWAWWPAWLRFGKQPQTGQAPVSAGLGVGLDTVSGKRSGTPPNPLLTITPPPPTPPATRRERERQRMLSGGLAERRGTPPLGMPMQRDSSPPANPRMQTRASSRRASGIPDLDDSGVLRR